MRRVDPGRSHQEDVFPLGEGTYSLDNDKSIEDQLLQMIPAEADGELATNCPPHQLLRQLGTVTSISLD